MNPQHQQNRKIWQSCCHKFYPPTVFHPAFQLLAQMAHVCFHGRKRVHARLCQQDRTQRPTRRNRGRFRWGGITTLGAFRTFTNIPGPGIRTANFAAFGPWSGGALEERRKPSEQRCAYACRCPEGVAAPLGCATLLVYTVAKDSGTIKLISILPLLTKLTLLKECTKPVPFHSTAN